jgi:hypothetical protein
VKKSCKEKYGHDSRRKKGGGKDEGGDEVERNARDMRNTG